MNEITFFDFIASMMQLVGDIVILLSLFYSAIIFVVRAILDKPLNRLAQQTALALFGVLFSTFGMIAKMIVERGDTAVTPVGFIIGFSNMIAALFLAAAIVLLVGTFVIPRIQP